MTTRREFLKRSALLGAAASLIAPSGLHAQDAPAAATPPTGSDSYTVPMYGSLTNPKAAPRVIKIPDVDGFKVLKGDFHMHTLLSDGKVMPTDRVDEAINNGFDAIAITDHIEYRPFLGKSGRYPLAKKGDDHNYPYELARSAAEKGNLLLVRGTEITKKTMPPGHFNALFAEDINPIAAVVDDWRKMLQVAADQGAFLLWNHPGWERPQSGGIEQGAPLRFTPAHEEVCKKGLMHGIEVFNGGQHYPIVSDWCNERDLALFSNSDIHPSEANRYGIQHPLRPMTLALAKERTLDGLREAFFARRTIGYAAGLLWGRDPWLPALFKASVEIKSINKGALRLINKSSLPCNVSAGGMAVELPPESTRHVARTPGAKNLTVLNWMIGMNKPLEVPIGP